MSGGFQAPLYWDIYAPLGLTGAHVVFTCHNFEYQGSISPADLASCGLSVKEHMRQDRMQDSFSKDRINLTKVPPHMHAHMRTCIQTYMHAYIHTDMYTHILTCMRTHIYTYIYRYIHTCIHTYIDTYKHTYMDTYT